jgi:uncharacterized protein
VRASSGRVVVYLAVAMLVAAVAFIAIGYRNAIADPIVRRLTLTVPDYPPGAAPVRIALFSDIHVHGPDMPPGRLEKIVDEINALHADVEIAAGDFLGNSPIGKAYSIDQSIAPLRKLKARLGVFAVLGNNDDPRHEDLVTPALERNGVHVLSNDAAAVGPLALGGIKGRIYRRSEWMEVRQQTYEVIERTPGVRVLIAHRPDEFALAPPSIRLVLAGHTHCGQVVLPLIGPLETGSDFGTKYLCGVVRDGSKVLVVTAGLGTSHVPLRIWAPPDMWLITIQSRK